MKKQEFVEHLAEQSGVSKSSAEQVMNALGSVVSKALGEGDDLVLPGVGKLATKERAERQGRNPQTGEALTIAAKTVVTFKVASALADHVA